MECPEDMTVEAPSGECSAIVDYMTPMATDSCAIYDTTYVTFNYTGDIQEFVIPENVTEVFFDVKGASGGFSSVDFETQLQQIPGEGGTVMGTLPVIEGETLYIHVGGLGGNSSDGMGGLGGYNGGGNGNFATSFAGGGGGGASDIRMGGMTLNYRVVVAGGGGGSSYNYEEGDNGGNGGDLIGQDGFTGSDDPYVIPGGGGTQISGGIFGQYPGYNDGFVGEFGQGGMGGWTTAGGGGGGGYFGGGGGSWNGGGGGSSYTSGATDVEHTQGGNIGDGIIVLGYLVNVHPDVELVEGMWGESEFPLGTTTVSFESSNEDGETVTCSFNVTVTSDLTEVDVVELTATASVSGATYQWFHCAGETLTPVDGATDQSFTVDTETDYGWYAVEVTNGECSEISDCVPIGVVGVGEHDSIEMNMYPNPNNGLFNIEFGTMFSGQLNIFDLSGRQVYSEMIMDMEMLQIELSDVPTGIYQIQALNSKYNLVRQLIIE